MLPWRSDSLGIKPLYMILAVFLVVALVVPVVGVSAARADEAKEWVTPTKVLEGNMRIAVGCSFVLDQNVYLHMVYKKYTAFPGTDRIEQAFFHTVRQLPDGGWSQPERITPWEPWGALFGQAAFLYNNMDVAKDSSGNLHVAYVSAPTGTFGSAPAEIRYLTNKNGGWSTPTKISGNDLAYLGDPNEQYLSNRDVPPSVAITNTDDIRVAYVDTDTNGTVQNVRTVTYSGGSWGNPATASSGGHNACRSASIVAAGTDYHLAYADNNAGVYYTEDNGAGWVGPWTVIHGGVDSAWGQARLKENGTDRFVLYRADTGGGALAVRHVEKTNGVWTPPVTASDGAFGLAMNPWFDVDVNSNLYLAYEAPSGIIPGIDPGSLVIYRKYDRTTTTWGSTSVIADQYVNIPGDIVYDGSSSQVAYSHALPTFMVIVGQAPWVNSDIYYTNNTVGSWSGPDVPSNPSGLPQYGASGIGPSGSSAILANRYDGNGHPVITEGEPGSWSDPTVISSNTGVNESAMATDSDGHQHVLFGTIPSTTFPTLLAYYTTDASGSWSAPVAIPGEFVSLAFDIEVGLDDTVHMLYGGAGPGGLEAKYVRYSNGAWSPAEVVSGPDPFAANGRLALDSAGNAHILYHTFGFGGMELRYNTNASGAWGTPVNLGGTFVSSGMNLAGGDPGEAHVIYNTSTLGTWNISMFYRKRNSDGSWSDPTLISGSDLTHWTATPEIELDSAGALHVMYVTRMYRADGCDYRVRYVKKSSSWSSPVTASGDLTRIDHVRMYLEGDDPHYAVSNDGDIYYGYSRDPFVSDTWYLAEGYTGNDNYQGEAFDTYALVANPTGTDTTIRATYMLPWNETRVEEYFVPKYSRFTIHLDDVEGLGNTEVSTLIESLDGVGIICERSMYFDYHGKKGGHNSIGVPETSDTWYLPEGYTGNGNYPGEMFDTFVLVMNPNDEVVEVNATFMKPFSETVEKTYQITERSRFTIPVDEVEGLDNTPVSTRIESSGGQGIVCERSMYFNYYGKEGGHDSIGATAPAINWYMPEGYTENNGDVDFDTYVLIQNPNPDQADVRASFAKEDGEVIEQDILIPADSRYTIHLNAVEGLSNASVSTRIESQNDVPVICERSEYFDYYGKQGGHDSIGVTHTARTWDMAEGYTGYDNYPGQATDTYVLIQNPSGTDTSVKATYLLPSGQVLENFYDIPKYSRFTIHLNEVNGLNNTSVATTIEAQNGVEVICERAMYFNYYGKEGGHSSRAYTHPL